MALEDVYDEPTLWAIDRDRPPRATHAVAGWRGAIVAGAMNAGIAGMREALDVPMPKPQVVEVSPDPAPRPGARVRLLFVPHAPRATRAFVRR
jgi:hypothetical protein